MISYGLCYVEVCLLYTHLVESFIINEYRILSKAFSATIEMIIRFLSFVLLMWCITLIDLQILNYPCIYLIMVYDPFNVLLDSVC